ncbi:hypothetical protein BKA64DRAFT_655356 [Cadophora sp. MPI-SDFR-AT-0126]|nr:hypothetical protein BKA64DRAFT_655356 [Leotiomycetes sp. MPI-SDFR-AT-0126]
MHRHFTDRHAETPRMYQCLYHSCTYESKRESNRHQHMEKTHGWDYKRSNEIKNIDRLHQMVTELNSGLMTSGITPFANPSSLPKLDSEDTSPIRLSNSRISVPGASTALPIEVSTSHESQKLDAITGPLQRPQSVEEALRVAELEVLRRTLETQGEEIRHLQKYLSIFKKQLQDRENGDERSVDRADSEQEKHQNAAKCLCTEENRTISSFVPVNNMRHATMLSTTTDFGDDDNTIRSCKRVKPLPDIMVNPNDMVSVKRARNTMAGQV